MHAVTPRLLSSAALALTALLGTTAYAQSAEDEGPPALERAASVPLGSDLAILRAGKYVQPLPEPQIFEWISDELPQTFARDLVQDPLGFLWIGTQAGLARYDGHDMRSYLDNPDEAAPSGGESLTLVSDFITALAIGPKGRLWIGTGEAGIAVYDATADTTKHYQKGTEQGSLGADGINVLHLDAGGTMWVGTADGVLDRYDPASDSFHHVRAFEEFQTGIAAIVDAGSGLLWVATEDAGLFKFDPESGEIVTHYLEGDSDRNLGSNQVRSVFVDKDVVWVGTAMGLDRLDEEKGSISHLRHQPQDAGTLSDDRVTALMVDSDGILWVGTENGLNRRDPGSDEFIRYVRTPSSPIQTASYPATITDIYEDRGGIMWFSSMSGVIKLDKLRMNLQPHYSLTGMNEVTSFANGASGSLWAGTYSTGLQHYDFAADTVTGYTEFRDAETGDSVSLNEWIMAVYRDRQNKVWFGGQGLGLVQFDPADESFRQYLYDPETGNGPSADQIHWITQDRDGYLWLATWGGGLNRFDPQWETFVEFRDEGSKESLSSDFLYVLHTDHKDPNILWIGTGRGGLNRFEIDNQKATQISLAPEGTTASGHDSIYTIHQDDAGILWLGTDGGGLVRFDPSSGAKTYYTTKDGLSSNTIYGVLGDDDGRLWLGTASGGLTVMDPASETFIIYGRAHGLVTDKLTQNSYFRTQDGTMYFAGGSGAGYSTGFNSFDPRAIEPDATPPEVLLTNFQIFDEEAELPAPIWTEPDLELGYTDSVFSFEFSALAFAAPDAVRYAYKMDGLHDWIETNRRFVTYTNIDGGNYTFRIKAANRQGTWGDESVVVAIHVAPPPWLSWWAYAIYLVIVFSILFAVWRYQARRLAVLQQAARLRAVEGELELTGAVQAGFLPTSNEVRGPLFGLFGFYRPADQASGDWWWYEESATKLTVIVGDVTGHGPGPAMVTAAAATAFRIQARETSRTIADRLRLCNEEVLRVGGGTYHMTMSVIELDGRTGRFTFYSAGGQPILRIRYDGKPRSLPCSGTPLGSEMFELGVVEGRMAPGERLLLYTDGIPEMPIGQNRLLGMRRFSTICESTAGMNLSESAQKVVLVADSLRQNAPQYDDWTFAVLEWSGQTQGTDIRDSDAAQWAEPSGEGFGADSNPDLPGRRPRGPAEGAPAAVENTDDWGRPSKVDKWLEGRGGGSEDKS
ncbi:two-component regulator propeller domain-containing protein [Haliangium ochraceum]|uniref:Two component regulator propeller domain protein n=1 Tax=Haliangium ochraceum (strain DSM 14365 / JCM 11303 / SMP-2) TaxID=502025 RepID=D0LQ54_HALO1|nr:two-component regulator propeller domain-containing protein [Haliangium ochraceum]ACY17091.1 two component regulator propeller domain protein [Haliangium ochraceum DSM 14365]